MIPRVSAALAQFIAPIANSGKQNLPQQGFERFGAQKKKGKSDAGNDAGQPKNPKQDEPPPQEGLAQVIPLRTKNKENETSPSIPIGISQALLQLVSLLQGQRATLQRWFGSGVYQEAARQQKKNGRIRKGTVLDEKAE